MYFNLFGKDMHFDRGVLRCGGILLVADPGLSLPSGSFHLSAVGVPVKLTDCKARLYAAPPAAKDLTLLNLVLFKASHERQKLNHSLCHQAFILKTSDYGNCVLAIVEENGRLVFSYRDYVETVCFDRGTLVSKVVDLTKGQK